MSLLSEEEIGAMTLPYSYAYINDVSACKEFVRTIEAAILAKLASAELPGPASVIDGCLFDNESDCCKSLRCTRREGVYTADQLHEAHAQGFAAGAAAQLADKPSAFTDADYMSIFVSEDIATDCGATIELYTRREA